MILPIRKATFILDCTRFWWKVSRCLLGFVSLGGCRFLLRCLRLSRAGCLDWNLALVDLRLRNGNGNLQDSILECGTGLRGIGSLGQWNGPIEHAIAAFGSMDTALVFFVLNLAFALNAHEAVVDVDLDVLFGKARQLRRHNHVAIPICDFDRWHPRRAESGV